MSDDTNPLEDAVEQALDTFLYAPIGLVFEGPALFPKLVEKGRNQVQVARMMGEMAVQMGQKEATKRARTAQEHVRGSLTTMGLVPTPHTDGATAGEHDAPSARSSGRGAEPPAPTANGAAGATADPAPSPEELGIPDYDSLSASQVVSRLRGLDADELERVKGYESATRARKTILNKIAQLQKD